MSTDQATRRRGRPRIGDVLTVRVSPEQRDQIKAAAQPLEAEADTARRLLALGAAIADDADLKTTVDALISGAQACRREAAGRSLIGPRFAEARAALRRTAEQREAVAAQLAAHLPTWLRDRPPIWTDDAAPDPAQEATP